MKLMHRRHSCKSPNARALERDAGTPDGTKAAQGDTRNTNLLLLISDDDMLGESLRDAAEEMGLLFACCAAGSSALWQFRALRPGAVVLDLDLPSRAAWETAEHLLKIESCPPLFLLTGRKDQLGDGTAVQAGPMVDRPPGPARLLRLAERVSSLSISDGRTSTQRIVVQWLGEYGWSVPVTSANGCRGIKK
jgi:CheY-like chemotaxis protein